MDKFTVDLEKVLDEFEFNEGREEAVSTLKNSLQHICQKPLRPPAASYRRAAFEPISLADADFAAAPIPSTTSYNKLGKHSKCPESFRSVSDSEIITQNTQLPVKVPNETSNQAEEEVIEDEKINENNQESQENYSVSSSEDTPDLLDSNTLKPTQNNANCDDDTESANQLPDITSIRNTPMVAISLEASDEPVFDLIKPHSSVGVSNEDDLPPVVEVGSIIKEVVPELCIKPVSFDSVEDIPDSELVEYLQSLEELEANNAAGTSNFEDSFQYERSHETFPIEPFKESSNHEEKITEVIDCQETDGVSDDRNLPEQNKEVHIDTSEETQADITPQVQCNGDISDYSESVQSEVALCAENKEGETSEESIVNGEFRESINSSTFVEDTTEDSAEYKTITTQYNCETDNSLQNLEVIGTENEEIENSQNEEKAVLHGAENTDPGENFGDKMAKTYYSAESTTGGDETEVGEMGKPPRPNTLPLPAHIVTDSEESPTPTGARGNGLGNMISPEERSLGKVPPFWVPDTVADSCMLCHTKFTVIKRRHHCRACGLVLCSKCCSLKAPLEYKEFQEVRVCQPCFTVIYRVGAEEGNFNLGRQPNPNNPMEYCSTIPPLQQAATALLQPPPSVLVPTGVLKREGRAKSDVPKQVIFSDGIRPGGDLTELDGTPESRLPPRRGVRRLATPPGGKSVNNFMRRPLNPTTQSFIPSDSIGLPPAVKIEHGHLNFIDDVTEVTDQPVKFSLNYNLFVNVKKVKLDCCVNRECWSISSEGLACIGQDEIAMVLECLPDEQLPPQDVFNLVNTLHQDASKGSTVNEMCFTPAFSSNLLGSKDHGGFLYIRHTLQCTTQLLLPAQPYLFAILVHRWETPWARLFPLRLILRLGAEYRYYPTTLVSIRNRPPLYTDIGHTIMKLLVDFRKYSYSLATVRGLLIHVEDRQTTILFPRNRYDHVVRALNNSNDSVLAFGANLSLIADSHLVCIQGTQDENTYHTQAINIHNKPRRVTGASFVVFNGALKTTGLSGKSSIKEDGLMVHLPSDSMVALRNSLCEMKDYSISCGPNDEETVLLKWTDDDTNFNIGVRSCIDDRPLDGIPSIRVHNGTDYPSHSKIIRWTEVFILQCEEGVKGNDPIDISKVSESLARSTCIALVPFLDILVDSNLSMLAVRATIHPDNVGYEAGSRGAKLPSQYMKRLDDELIPVVHQAAVSSQDTPAVLELIFRIMNHP